MAQSIDVNKLQSGGGAVHGMPPAIVADVLQAFTLAFRDLFLWAIPFALIGFVIALFLKERPSRSAHHDEQDIAH